MEPLTDANLIVFIQLTASMLLGGLLGLERSIAGKAAGMRTYALVSMGTTLFIVAATLGASEIAVFGAVDPLRITAAVITGIGFIGAGTIIFRKDALKGLTTAAGLWIAAGVGVAIGYQLYATAVFATLLTLFAFTILWYVERWVETKTIQPEERTAVLNEKEK